MFAVVEPQATTTASSRPRPITELKFLRIVIFSELDNLKAP
jgi:hypothetical protein